MINPNRNTSEDVLRRLKEASYERMRVELKCSVELKLKDFEMTWDDLGELLGVDNGILFPTTRAERTRELCIQGNMPLAVLNKIAHVFSCEPYIIFRPREPWTKT